MVRREARLETGEVITVIEAAARHGCSERAIRKAISEHRLAAVKVGRDWHITLEDFDTYRFGAKRIA